MSNGWKSLEIRNKSYVEKKIIWHLEINENLLSKFGHKTCIGHPLNHFASFGFFMRKLWALEVGHFSNSMA